MQKKILFLDSNHPAMLELLRGAGFVCDEDYSCSRDQLLEKIAGYDGVVIRSRFKLDASFLDAAKSLRCIGRAGAGMENIDFAYAESKGICCVHAPEGNRIAVGEHALGMLLSLMNNFLPADCEVRNGVWKREENRGTELTGKTVGIIGFGNMGTAFAKVLAGFDVKILVYDKYKSGFANDTIEETSLNEIFLKADVLSMHVPLTAETNGMINENFLNSFTKPIWLLNTSRGKVLDTSALIAALNSGRVKGAGLDVLEFEATSFESISSENFPASFQQLIQSDKVILSPHVAGWTHESHLKIAEVLAGKMIAVLQ